MDFSLWALFAGADFVVQLVMIALVAASMAAWSIFFSKVLLLRRLNTLSSVFEHQLWYGNYPLERLYKLFGKNPKEPFSNLFQTGLKEGANLSHVKTDTMQAKEATKKYLEDIVSVLARKELQGLQTHIGFLASIASTSPFIGLFGTVWGIMGSFEAIAKAGDTSLTVVAPAIAEALFATALGLFVAIPATLCYNKLTNDLKQYGVRLQTFSKQLCLFLAKELATKGIQRT
ncbi:MAG: MotA/TolQ/ExbB proton channel family protein [Holosporaceae bacterium]